MTRYQPVTDHPAYGMTTKTRNLWGLASNDADDVHATARRRRLMVSIVGTAGFLALLLGAHFAGGFQKLVQVAALVWFLAFGVARLGLDLRLLQRNARV